MRALHFKKYISRKDGKNVCVRKKNAIQRKNNMAEHAGGFSTPGGVFIGFGIYSPVISTDDEDCAPPQFPTEPPPDNFDEEVSDKAQMMLPVLSHALHSSIRSFTTYKCDMEKKTVCNSAKS
ncbi:hypothetical protein NPIL_362371 [Nephila pilipes]|uniref:Uncharacterized protein n=1 Tax=Nephila pilipes TaxID=299642 RepID=A0A8X6T6T1_NEPPI|nr:hypothetical protein NPIL_362371 [Nephila pilipes]